MECQVKEAKPHKMIWYLKEERNKIESCRCRCFELMNIVRISFFTANLSKRSVAFATSIFENGINEFFTDGIIHCWNKLKITFAPMTTSKIRFNKKRLRIRVVRGKFNS